MSGSISVFLSRKVQSSLTESVLKTAADFWWFDLSTLWPCEGDTQQEMSFTPELWPFSVGAAQNNSFSFWLSFWHSIRGLKPSTLSCVNGPLWLMCLDTCSPLGGTVWEGSGGMALLEEAYGISFPVYSVSQFVVLEVNSLSFLPPRLSEVGIVW